MTSYQRRPYHENVQPVISAQQMREIDRLTTKNYQIPSLELMESAAAACFRSIDDYFSNNLTGKRALILCGPGNNGGDGAALARQLAVHGAHANVLLFANLKEQRGDAQHNFELLRKWNGAQLSLSEGLSAEDWRAIAKEATKYDVIVDALFGTGLKRPLEGVFADVVGSLNSIRNARSNESPLIVSIDLPSGLDADCEEPIGPCVNADLTVTFTAPKIANVLPPAVHSNGKLVIANIGSPQKLVDATASDLFLFDEQDAKHWLTTTRYQPESYKKTHGDLLIVAGSSGYAGAAVLCANAAMRSGVGLVTVATPASLQNAVASAVMPEVMTRPLAETDRGAVSDEALAHFNLLTEKATVVAIGPGLSASDERTRRFVYAAVSERKTPTIIDADGLNCLSPWPKQLRGSDEKPLILTPHIGEMRRLLGTDEHDKLENRVLAARDFAVTNNVIVVFKGSRTLIAAPNGNVFVNPTGNAGMGTAGSGDTVTGIIAGFVAQDAATLKEKSDVLKATCAAVYVAGLSADIAAQKIGMRTMIASDFRNHFGEAIRSLDPIGEKPRVIQ